MLDLLTNAWLTGLIAPVFAVALSIYVRCSTFRDGRPWFSRENLAVGPDLAITAVMALIITTPTVANAASRTALAAINAGDTTGPSPAVAAANSVLTSWFVIVILLLGLWIVSNVIRKVGWDENGSELLWLPGFIIPMLYGLGALVGATYWISINV